MTQELIIADRWGREMRGSANFKRAKPPKLGETFDTWAGRDGYTYATMPGGAVLQFDLSRLTLTDFRQMRDHYQINSSLTLLSFMLHQMEWHAECKDKKIAQGFEENLRKVWPRLMRAMSTAFWAGRAPTIVQWENGDKYIEITKFKDIAPEDAWVNWKQVDGYAPPGKVKPKINVYDGIKTVYSGYPIPSDNSLWYPLLMENGDYSGRKLLRSAFPSYFFSILMHLFANRYYERFGEPVPIGRAPLQEEVTVNGQSMSGRDAMMQMLENLRNRSVVVLPSERQMITPTRSEYEYDIQYLESQMRGADFERYMTRLDEEMSIGMFTPLLMMRTADVGSYNLGVGHTMIYLWMLNALSGDMNDYIGPYIAERWKAINFSPKAPQLSIKFRPLGKENAETMRAIAAELVRSGAAKPDLVELGQSIGLTFSEIKQITAPPAAPGQDPSQQPQTDPRTGRQRPNPQGPRGVDKPRATTKQISARVRGQVEKAWREDTFGSDFTPTIGYKRQFEEALREEGWSESDARALTDQTYAHTERWLGDAVSIGKSGFSGGPEEFIRLFENHLDCEVEEIAAA